MCAAPSHGLPTAPWYRKDRDGWFVQVDGKRYNLKVKGKENREEALSRFYALMASRGGPTAAPTASNSTEGKGNATAPLTVGGLIAKRLSFIENNKAKGTLAFHKPILKQFELFLGEDHDAQSIKPARLQEFLDTGRTKVSRKFNQRRTIQTDRPWTATTKSRYVCSIKGCWHWAVEMEEVERNPFAKFRAPSPERDERVLTSEEYEGLLTAATPSLSLFLRFQRATGCRPHELRLLCPRHLDRVNHRWVFPTSESKGRRKPRVIYPPKSVWDAVVSLAEGLPRDEPILKSTHGVPWTRTGLHSCLYRAAKRAGLAGQVHARTLRHTFATEAIIGGVDILTVVELMGHADATMVAKHYAHLARRSDHLQKASEIAGGA
jgi:integrase